MRRTWDSGSARNRRGKYIMNVFWVLAVDFLLHVFEIGSCERLANSPPSISSQFGPTRSFHPLARDQRAGPRDRRRLHFGAVCRCSYIEVNGS